MAVSIVLALDSRVPDRLHDPSNGCSPLAFSRPLSFFRFFLFVRSISDLAALTCGFKVGRCEDVVVPHAPANDKLSRDVEKKACCEKLGPKFGRDDVGEFTKSGKRQKEIEYLIKRVKCMKIASKAYQ